MPATSALSRRSLLLAKVESQINVDARPTPAFDAFLVADADIRMDMNVLERDFYRTSLSNLPIAVGRKLASITFRHEVKGAGAPGRTAAIGKLLRMCGFAQTNIPNTAAATISGPNPDGLNIGPAVTWAKTSAAVRNRGRYSLRVVAAGASAAAKVRVSGNTYEGDDNTILLNEDFSATVMDQGKGGPIVAVSEANPAAPTYTVSGNPAGGEVIVGSVGGYRWKYTVPGGATVASVATGIAAAMNAIGSTAFNAAAAAGVVTATVTGGTATVTSATAFDLGQSGAQVSMSWAGSLELNDRWYLDVLAPGIHYTPVSTNFETGTIYMYYENQLHRLTGCIGTVSFTAEAGAYATANFTLTGQYYTPEDAPLPLTPVVESSRPQQVELAQLQLGNLKALRAQSFSIDMAITTAPRDSVSHKDGYDGILYTARAPSGGLNPEMNYESEEPYWRYLTLSNLLSYHGRVGSMPGNIVHFLSNSAQLSSIGYADRNNNRTYDMSVRFVAESSAGDDEIRIVFE